MEKLGRLIESARLRRGKSQEAVAAEADMTQSKYSRLERLGRGGMKDLPPPEDLAAVGQALGLSMEDMLREAGYLEQTPLEEGDAITIRRDDPRAAVLARLDDATDDEIDTIKGIINVIVSHSPRRGTEGVSSDGKPKQSDDAGGRTA